MQNVGRPELSRLRVEFAQQRHSLGSRLGIMILHVNRARRYPVANDMRISEPSERRMTQDDIDSARNAYRRNDVRVSLMTEQVSCVAQVWAQALISS